MTEDQTIQQAEQAEQNPRGNGPETIAERAQRSRESIPVGKRGLEPKTYQDNMVIARDRSKAYDLLPQHMHDNAAVMVSFIELADRCRLDPVMMAAHTYIPTGSRRLAFDAQLFTAIAYGSEKLLGRLHYETIGEGDEMRMKVSGRFKDMPDEWHHRTSPPVKQLHPGYVTKEGTKYVKGSQLWDKDPEQQLSYYTERAWLRRHAPDLIMGMFTPEEILEMEEAERAQRALNITPAVSSGLVERLEAGKIETGEGFQAAELAEEPAGPTPTRRPARPARTEPVRKAKPATRPAKPAKAKTSPRPSNRPAKAKARKAQETVRTVQPSEKPIEEDAEPMTEWQKELAEIDMSERARAYVDATLAWIKDDVTLANAENAYARFDSEFDDRDEAQVPIKARLKLKAMLDEKLGAADE